MQKSQWKIDFLHIFSPVFQDFFSFYTPLEHTNIFGVGLEVVPPGLGVISITFDFLGVGGLYKSLN